MKEWIISTFIHYLFSYYYSDQYGAKNLILFIHVLRPEESWASCSKNSPIQLFLYFCQNALKSACQYAK